MQGNVTSSLYGSIDPLQVETGSREVGDCDQDYWGGERERNSHQYALVHDSMMNDEEDTEEAEYSSNYIIRHQDKNFERPKRSRRWSVIEKLEKRHYCRIRNCTDCGKILNCKCLLATCMLGIFIVMAVTFAHVLFFATEVGSVRFDYIVVGAGPGGSLLANRLVNKGATVLLLESGNYTQYEVFGRDYFAGPVSRFDIPLLWPAASQYTDFKWKMGKKSDSQSRSSPRPSESDHEVGSSHTSSILQAKGVGGNGILGAMIYMRALPGDIRRWASPVWTWERMLSLYQSLEHFDSAYEYVRHPASYETDAFKIESDEKFRESNFGDQVHHDVHGKCDGGSVKDCGRIVTASPTFIDSLSAVFLAAAYRVGIGKTVDFNDHNIPRRGAGIYHFNIADGVRDSAARRFLKPILHEPGLVLEVGASVTQILMNADVSLNATYPAMSGDPPAYRAIGVEFVQNGQLKRAFLRNAMIPEKLQTRFDAAPRGVILAAGSMMTPKLLMQSGVGPEDRLREAGIDPKVISEGVGKNLRDHPTVAVVMAIDDHLAALLSSGYDILSGLPQYVDSITLCRAHTPGARKTPSKTDSKSGSGVPESIRHDEVPAEFGVLGSPGIGAGAFLRSPIPYKGASAEQDKTDNLLGGDKDKKRSAGSSSTSNEDPDIQLTLYPFVPEEFARFLNLDSKLGAVSEGRHRRRNPTTVARSSSYITVAVSLLRPDASMEVYLNQSDASILGSVEDLPSIIPPLSSRETSGKTVRDSENVGSNQQNRQGGTKPASRLNLGTVLSKDDIARLFWGVSQARDILREPPLANHTLDEQSPGGHIDSSEALQDWFLSDGGRFSSANNWCGSAHFGPYSDPLSVLDEQMRVRGVQDLRVADSSALPALPSGNIQATVLALAESVAEDILLSS